LIIACCLSAMTASAQSNIDLRMLTTRYNPATVIAPEANNVLDLNYQILTAKLKSDYVNPYYQPKEIYVSHFGILNYAHNFHFGTNTLTTGGYYLGNKSDYTDKIEFGLNVAYTKAFNNKYFLSLGSNVRMSRCQYAMYICGTPRSPQPDIIYSTNFEPQVNTGLHYRVQYNKNNNLRFGLGLTNWLNLQNRSDYYYYDIASSPFSFNLNVASDFMISKRFGLSPSILFFHKLDDAYHSEYDGHYDYPAAIQFGSDVRYLLTDNQDLRLTYQYSSVGKDDFIGLRYTRPKLSVGVMYNLNPSGYSYNTTNLQTNIQYRF
jgi:hypothetical protein